MSGYILLTTYFPASTQCPKSKERLQQRTSRKKLLVALDSALDRDSIRTRHTRSRQLKWDNTAMAGYDLGASKTVSSQQRQVNTDGRRQQIARASTVRTVA